MVKTNTEASEFNTPKLRRYFDAKQVHKDMLLGISTGGWYQFYGPDALAVASALELPVALCHNPKNCRTLYSACVDHKLVRQAARQLVDMGYRVALIDYSHPLD